jgi:hypothetical protein
VDVPGEERLDLAFVTGVQDVIEGEAAFFEVLLETVPDGDNLRVIRDSAEQQRCV